MAGAEVAVVEGAGGLFDSHDEGASDEGSTAQMAAWLNAPVVLVVDCQRAGSSVAAVVKGFAGLEEGVRVAGVVLNRVASA